MPLRPGEETLRSGGNWLIGDDYYNLVTGFKKSHFRLQVQPVYKVGWEQEDFQQFLKTGRREVNPDSPEFIKHRELRAAGKISQRVYVVTPPLTDYQRYVFGYYHYSALAGEDLRVIDLSRGPNPGLPDYDFILLDEKTVVKLHYEKDDGTYIGRELLPDADPVEYIRYKGLAVANSIPFLEYEELIAG